MIIDPQEHKRVLAARQHLVMNFPFWATLTGRLKYEQAAIGTADVDGVTLRTDPAFTATLPFDELVGVVAHEGGHCGLCHHARRGSRDPQIWNIACDLALNPILIAAGLKLPQGALIDRTMVDDKGRPLPAEVIYTRLKQAAEIAQDLADEDDEDDPVSDETGEGETESESEGEGSGDGEGDEADDGVGATVGDTVGPTADEEAAPSYGGCGSFRDAPAEAEGGDAQTAQTESAQQWEIATMQAVAAAKAAGELPGFAQWMVEQVKESRVDWREVLRDFVQVRVRSEATWSRPNRRHLHTGTYLPSRDTKEIGELVVISDASGSCWGPLQEQFAAEFNSIAEDLRPRLTHLVYWDTKCQGHEEVEADDLPLTFEARGGGGTVYSGIWDWIEEQGIEPVGVVVLTDLEVFGFGTEPAYPVLWCTTLRTYAPFGEVVELTL